MDTCLLFSSNSASQQILSATASKAPPASISLFFSVVGETDGKFNAPRKVFTAVSPMPQKSIAETRNYCSLKIIHYAHIRNISFKFEKR